MKRIFSFIYSLLFIFVCIQGSFANENLVQSSVYEIESNYQKKVLSSFEKKYNLNSLSENELNTLNKLIKITNKNNYKPVISVLKTENLECLDKIADTEINDNLKNSNANKKMYETAYILIRKGLFTKFPDENLIKPTLKIMYGCDNPINNYNLAVYGAVYLYHKENEYNFKELLDSTDKNNYKDKLKEITANSNCDLKRFFPENEEMSILISNMPKTIKESIGIGNEIEAKALSPAKCIINPNYYAVNMLMVSTKMDGATKKGAVIGLINPINIVSNIFLAPIYLLGNYLTPINKN